MSLHCLVSRHRYATVAVDVGVLLAISLAAEAGHFAVRQGRHLITADSVQYVDGARALLDGAPRAHFDFRKPGYSFVLAGAQLAFGNMAWGAVVVNSLFQALLPLAAYGVGRLLQSRAGGWLAAVFVIALLQTQFRAERIMSEAVYTTVVSFGLLAAAWVVKRASQNPGLAPAGSPCHTSFGMRSTSLPNELGDGSIERPCGPRYCAMVVAGSLLGAAWFLRASATAPILATTLLVLSMERRSWPRVLRCTACFLVPVACFFVAECAVNQRFAGVFRPGTGTLGPGLLMRARAYLDLPPADGDARSTLVSLLPERSREDAFAGHPSDTWVAWYRARRDLGMSEWQINELMRESGWRSIAQHPVRHLKNAIYVFNYYLTRAMNADAEGGEKPASPRTPIRPDGVAAQLAAAGNPFLPWALPLRERATADALVVAMQRDAEGTAPFGRKGVWAALRYGVMHPLTTTVLGWVRRVATLWPGLAIILAIWLRLDLRVCALFATAYLLDAAMVANFTSSEGDLARYGYVWLATDASLTAAGLCAAAGRVFTWFRTATKSPASLPASRQAMQAR